MRQLARTPEADQRPPAPPAPEIRDLGGPVGAMYKSLAERLAVDPIGLLPVAPDGVFERALRIGSRCAGPLALVLGYFAAAHLLLG